MNIQTTEASESASNSSLSELRKGILQGWYLSIHTSINQYCINRSLAIFPRDSFLVLVEWFESFFEQAKDEHEFTEMVIKSIESMILQPISASRHLDGGDREWTRIKNGVSDFAIRYVMNPNTAKWIYETYMAKKEEVLHISEKSQRDAYISMVSFGIKEKISYIIG